MNIYSDVIESTLLSRCLITIKTWYSDAYGWVTVVRHNKDDDNNNLLSFYAKCFIEIRCYETEEEAKKGHQDIIKKYK